MSIFSEKLAELRQKSGLTQQEVADLININRGSYSNWENGKREPNLDNVVKLSKIFNTTTDELLGQTIYSRVDVTRFLSDFDVSDIKNFSKVERDKLKWAILFEMTQNKIKAFNLKDNLITKYKLDEDEREILNTIFIEVQKDISEAFPHRKH